MEEPANILTPKVGGLRLEFPDGRVPVTALEEINDTLAPFGSRVWPLDYGSVSKDMRKLLAQPTLSEAESDTVMQNFLLTRQRLLKLIAEAGRKPQVPGGGEMSTFVVNHNYAYPQLFVVDPNIDYSRFDRFHVNTCDDGTGADELMQVLSGGGVSILQRPPNEGVVTLHVSTTDQNGWIVSYNGGYPHIGSISGAAQGTKVLMQIIGPARWMMRYDDEA